MAFKIIGIGEILWDVFPDQEHFGGAPCNFACSASELALTDANVYFVGAVGNDKFQRRSYDALEQRGVRTEAMQRNSATTGRVIVTLDSAGTAAYTFDSESAWDFLDWNETLATLANQCHAVCFGTLGQRGAQSRETIRRFVAATPRTAFRVLDINLRAPYFDDSLIRESIALANVLKLNETELPVVANACDCHGSGTEVLLQLAERFSLDTVALTKGESGATLYSRGHWSHRPYQPVVVADTVGAGDAYTATLVLGLLLGDDIESINRKAIQVASYVCTRPGATMPFPFRYADLE